APHVGGEVVSWRGVRGQCHAASVAIGPFGADAGGPVTIEGGQQQAAQSPLAALARFLLNRRMTISSRDLENVPRPVVALADEYPANFVDPRHHHARAQLLYAASGVMSIVTDRASYVVPPQRAIWMPAGVDHEVTCRSAVSIRTLYVDAAGDTRRECRVIEVS